MDGGRPGDDDRLRAAAAEVLRRNDRGTMTTAAPQLYPHLWSWDAAFVAIGWSRIDVPRAITELRTLLRAQWATGMLPHIVFTGPDTDYFPGPDRWGTASVRARPAGVATSGICQPPVHALAVAHIVARGRENGGRDEELALGFLAETFDRWLAWHRWLATARDPQRTGLIEIHHSWESGFDNSPRWDAPYARVHPGAVAPFTRRDTRHVPDAAQRPDDTEYAKYLWLVQQMAGVGYDDDRVPQVVDFRVRDVFFSAILAAASDVLADLGAQLHRRTESVWLRELAARCRDAVAGTVDPDTGLARDYDVRAAEWLAAPTIAGFAPLVAGGPADLLERQRQLLRGGQWMGHPGLRFPLPPSTSPTSPAFAPRGYWRGPVWPVLNLLLGWASRRDGAATVYRDLRSASLHQLADLRFGEYYEPCTGEALGSRDQAWTAAAALEWLGPDCR